MDERNRSERHSQRVNSPICGANKRFTRAIPAGDHSYSVKSISPLNFYPAYNNMMKREQDTHNSINSRVI
ncbi:MAG: hypothetical protein WBA22_16965 [Candidatus Methanofastidiosia archaeon]